MNIGQRGEDLACEFLKKKGYAILARNYRKPWGEIDIVTRAKDGTLVFIEVKTMAQENDASIGPEDHATGSKMRKVRKTCEGLVNRNPKLLNEKRGWRIDLVAIVMDPSFAKASEDKGGEPTIRHYENV